MCSPVVSVQFLKSLFADSNKSLQAAISLCVFAISLCAFAISLCVFAISLCKLQESVASRNKSLQTSRVRCKPQKLDFVQKNE